MDYHLAPEQPSRGAQRGFFFFCAYSPPLFFFEVFLPDRVLQTRGKVNLEVLRSATHLYIRLPRSNSCWIQWGSHHRVGGQPPACDSSNCLPSARYQCRGDRKPTELNNTDFIYRNNRFPPASINPKNSPAFKQWPIHVRASERTKRTGRRTWVSFLTWIWFN